MFVVVNRYSPMKHGGQDHCHECGATVDYRLELLTVRTNDGRPTRSYHVPCWDHLVEVVRAVIEEGNQNAPVDDDFTFIRYAAPAPAGTTNNRWRCGPCGAEETTEGHWPPFVCASCGWADGMWKWLGSSTPTPDDQTEDGQ